MAEYGYGYQSAFGRHTPMFNAEVTERLPQLAASDAKPSMASGKYAATMSKLSPKQPDIEFQVELEENPGSNTEQAINPTKDVVGANPEGPNVSDEQRIGKLFPPGALPKLQSFKAAIHSDGTKLLIVGGRTAGLHPFGSAGFLQTLQNHALFVINMPTSGLWQTAGAALPSAYFQKLALMNTQACQVKVNDKNYLYVVGGYGFDTDYKDMVTFPLLTVIDVDATINVIWEASQKGTTPVLDKYISLIENQMLQVTGGQLHFNEGSNQPSKKDHLHLIVGQAFSGAYASDSNDFYSYIRGIRKFELPVPNELGELEEVNVIEVKATVDTAPNAHDVAAMGVALARRDLNVVPSFLPGTYLPAGDNKPAQCSPGAVILSGVFNQDGSDAPYLQPVVVNFNQTLSPVDDPDTKIPVYSSRSFFQLFNNYDCANAQLLSQKAGKTSNEAAQYNVLLGGVSYFFKTPDSVGSAMPIDQVSSLFSAPFTTDISIVKMDVSGSFTQHLVPPQNEFFKNSKLSTFGTEAFFIHAADVPLTPLLPSYMGIMDYDKIKEQAQKGSDGKLRFKIGTIYGGIESTVPTRYPPHFSPSETDASSRLIDVYVTFPST